ncbi:hypothetical protein BpHYR1_038427 [Brachionus plicatilis]|uniref:Uncharacterized protein n=1 Tax=Brachionus plicatilis TaxID=10195 RepID=A0A3M7PZW0_BRAPC|nr:hypothetical protein BpHYR1_038427 [Brachionus plicatilis]
MEIIIPIVRYSKILSQNQIVTKSNNTKSRIDCIRKINPLFEKLKFIFSETTSITYNRNPIFLTYIMFRFLFLPKFTKNKLRITSFPNYSKSAKKEKKLPTLLIGRLRVSVILRAAGFRGLLDGVCTEQTFMKAIMNTISPTTMRDAAHQ